MLKNTIKKTVKNIFHNIGVDIRLVNNLEKFKNIPDFEFYDPVFSPWKGYSDFQRSCQLASSKSLVSNDRLYVLYALAKQCLNIVGEYWECGVYKGGTALLLSDLIKSSNAKKKLRLFDTFEGMPTTNPDKDLFHNKGDFSDTSIEAISGLFEKTDNVELHAGYIPDTFKNLDESKIAFAHVDVDIYKSVLDCCNFIYPRLQNGGVIVFDDYGFPSCPGARQAVDEFFKNKKEVPLVLSTGQAVVYKI